MLSKRNIALTSLTLFGAAVLVLTQTAGSNQRANKLGGAWIQSVPETPLLFNGVFVPTDASGRRAALYGSLLVRIPAELYSADLAPTDHGSDYVGEAVMTGPDTAKFTMMGHAIQKVAPSPEYPFFEQVPWLWVANGEIKINGPDKMDCTMSLSVYPLGEDGLPDTSQAPMFSMPGSAKMTRVGF